MVFSIKFFSPTVFIDIILSNHSLREYGVACAYFCDGSEASAYLGEYTT